MGDHEWCLRDDAVHLFISVWRQNAYTKRDFLKNKQFRATVFIENQ